MLLRLVSHLGHAVVQLLRLGYRFRGTEVRPLDGGGAGEPYILAIWHRNLFAGILAQTGRPHVVMVSRSRRADPLTHVCRRLGHTVVGGGSRRGARDKGGQQAKEQMIDVLRGGMPGAITVDGPTGPALEVKMGIIEIARRTGLPIVPYAALPRRYWTFATWDRFRLPKPFTSIEVRYGAPLWVDADATPATLAALQQTLAAQIMALDPPAPSTIPQPLPAA